MTDPAARESGFQRVIVTIGRYRLTENDSVEAVKLDGVPSRNLTFVYGIIALVFVVLVLAGPPGIRLAAGLGLAGGVVGEALGRHVIVPLRRRRSYRRNTLFTNDFTIEVSDKDIRIFTAVSDITLAAEKVMKWKEGKRHIFIYISKRAYFTVPKRLAAETFDQEALRARLRQSRQAAG